MKLPVVRGSIARRLLRSSRFESAVLARLWLPSRLERDARSDLGGPMPTLQAHALAQRNPARDRATE
ncbi:MAG: hypothetical protein IPN34_11085 [Planctomycetes bacterium]|nr:hypothetical protein [Planctomycetota bacterium]